MERKRMRRRWKKRRQQREEGVGEEDEQAKTMLYGVEGGGTLKVEATGLSKMKRSYLLCVRKVR
jgi:hypothetical protein